MMIRKISDHLSQCPPIESFSRWVMQNDETKDVPIMSWIQSMCLCPLHLDPRDPGCLRNDQCCQQHGLNLSSA